MNPLEPRDPKICVASELAFSRWEHVKNDAYTQGEVAYGLPPAGQHVPNRQMQTEPTVKPFDVMVPNPRARCHAYPVALASSILAFKSE